MKVTVLEIDLAKNVFQIKWLRVLRIGLTSYSICRYGI
jgi:hypothetical protein